LYKQKQKKEEEKKGEVIREDLNLKN